MVACPPGWLRREVFPFSRKTPKMIEWWAPVFNFSETLSINVPLGDKLHREYEFADLNPCLLSLVPSR
jgi:hypothetical protein